MCRRTGSRLWGGGGRAGEVKRSQGCTICGKRSHSTQVHEQVDALEKRRESMAVKRTHLPAELIGVGDASWCLAKQALEEKWNDAKLGPEIAKFAMEQVAMMRKDLPAMTREQLLAKEGRGK